MNEPSYEGAYGAPARNSDLALYSLIAGVLAYFLFPVVGAIAAIILGHMGLGEIRRSGGDLGGKGMAVGGLVLGYLQIIGSILLAALAVLGAMFFFVRAESMAEKTAEAKMSGLEESATLQAEDSSKDEGEREMESGDAPAGASSTEEGGFGEGEGERESGDEDGASGGTGPGGGR